MLRLSKKLSLNRLTTGYDFLVRRLSQNVLIAHASLMSGDKFRMMSVGLFGYSIRCVPQPLKSKVARQPRVLFHGDPDLDGHAPWPRDWSRDGKYILALFGKKNETLERGYEAQTVLVSVAARFNLTPSHTHS